MFCFKVFIFHLRFPIWPCRRDEISRLRCFWDTLFRRNWEEINLAQGCAALRPSALTLTHCDEIRLVELAHFTDEMAKAQRVTCVEPSQNPLPLFRNLWWVFISSRMSLNILGLTFKVFHDQPTILFSSLSYSSASFTAYSSIFKWATHYSLTVTTPPCLPPLS